MPTTSSLCFTPTSGGSTTTSSDLNSAIFTSLFPTHLIKPPPPTTSEPPINWDTTTTTNTNFIDASTTISWGQETPVEAQKDDIKWSEYLNSNPFFLTNNTTVTVPVQQHHQVPCIYSTSDEVKPETFINVDESSSMTSAWHQSSSSSNHHHHHQQPSFQQSSDLYSKDLHRFSLAFGQTM
ncbi:hypothetical protein PIB30_051010 [Stylosanthes scabra]|uniref:Uncharacterized protein n=1 Tax=Stylosanthes scabra TaxID=79078 RepID=A0ABU6VGA5_9FABA|nr:hypothetical protein [Stylosanthes scabra]